MDINWNFRKISHLSLNQLSLLFSFIIGITTLAVLLFTSWAGLFTTQFSTIFWWVLITILISYFVLHYLLNRIVYQRLKVIYQLIHDIENPDASENSTANAPVSPLTIAEKEVRNWLNQKETDMAELSKLEDYRREYIGNVSHELKTPVFNIQGFLQTLVEGGVDDPAVRDRFLQKALKNADRLQTIIEDLETISKLESRQSEPEKISFDIRKLTLEIMSDFEESALKKQISLGLKAGADDAFFVSAEKEMIRIVIGNLIQNSIKYGRKEGWTKVGFYDMEHKVLIEVSDNGEGIAKEHQKHIFDRFYRADQSRSRDKGGSGLGLSIVKHILESHQQKISVRSTEGNGSTFSFTLDKSI
ncbi:MAG: sensor histidine kinase [Saprospiraceae bacterium]|nr:sensor histidine kinase [Saprospiraceae bacterium]